MDIYDATIPQVTKMLRNLEGFLDQAGEKAKSGEFSEDNFAQARLAPDMFPLVGQVQAAADAAKFLGARLSQTDPPKDEDNETTLAELRGRLRRTAAFLEGLPREAFAGAEERILKLPLGGGVHASGQDYAVEFALPNFYFHVTTAYALLRTNGVPLGKRKYIGSVNVRPEP